MQDSTAASDPPSSISAVIATAEDFVKHHFANHDPSHDWHHVHRVRLFALHLSRDPSLPSRADMVVLELGALFHDMCDAKYLPPPQNDGEKAPTANAHNALAPFFDSIGDAFVTAEQRSTVEKIVDNVSWSKDEKRRKAKVTGEILPSSLDEWQDNCVEFWCVSDADRLDAIGSIGILRVAAYSATKNRPLHIPPNNAANDSVPPAEQSEGYNGSAIAHFHDKLLKIKGDRLRTHWAQEEAERRQGMLQSFLLELDLEWLVTAQGQSLSLIHAGEVNEDDVDEDAASAHASRA